MNGLEIIFIVVAAVTLFSAVMVVSVRNLMHAALWLVLALMGVAIIFTTLQASFFAVTQLLVYVGAIAILIIFGVMLTRKVMEDTGSQVIKSWWLPALVSALLFALIMVFVSSWSGFQTALNELPAGADSVVDLGKALVDPAGYVIPFEVASVLLLAALVGSIYIAIDRKEKSSS